jgi:hypothetical protein
MPIAGVVRRRSGEDRAKTGEDRAKIGRRRAKTGEDGTWLRPITRRFWYQGGGVGTDWRGESFRSVLLDRNSKESYWYLHLGAS